MTRILLADDNPHAQRMGTEILTQEGFEVLGVTEGAKVLETLERFTPDLILADVCMPVHSGYQICETIKADPARKHIKVVLLVGPVDPFDPGEAQRVGIDAVLQKPFEASLVKKTVGSLLASPRAGHEEFERAVQRALKNSSSEVDPKQIRAAVVLAVESVLPEFLDELTRRVVDALGQTRG